MPTATYVFGVDWGGYGTVGSWESQSVVQWQAVSDVQWQAWEDDEASTDVETGNVMSLDCSRGRDFASQLTGRSVAGRCDVQLDNTADRFNSFRSAGPLYGKLLPGRRVRLRTTSPVATSIWTGWLDTIAPSIAQSRAKTARLTASGALKRLKNKRAYPQVSSGAATGALLEEVLDSADWPASDRGLDAGQTTTGRWGEGARNALSAVRSLEETEMGFMLEGVAWDLLYEDRHHRLTSDHIVSQATFSDGGSPTQGYEQIAQADPLRETFNEVTVGVQAYSQQSLAVLWTHGADTPTLIAGESKTWLAEYPNVSQSGAVEHEFVSGTNLVPSHVHAWTTPVVGTDVTQSGVSDSDLAVAVAKSAKRMSITITNNHASSTATLTKVQARGQAVTKDAISTVREEDATSQAAFGQRTYRLPGAYYSSTSEGQEAARYVLSRYKNPLPVLTMSYTAGRGSNELTQALTRTISDQITLVASSAAGLGINRGFFIENIRHQVSAGGMRHQTSWKLSPVSGDAGYWILGVSRLGEETALVW